MFKVYLSHLVDFNQAFCTLVMWYCHTRGASRIRFQIEKSRRF